MTLKRFLELNDLRIRRELQDETYALTARQGEQVFILRFNGNQSLDDIDVPDDLTPPIYVVCGRGALTWTPQ